jgi:hypothetical protein
VVTTDELAATRLSAEITVTSPSRLASPLPLSGSPAPVSEVTRLSFSTMSGARSPIRLAPG